MGIFFIGPCCLNPSVKLFRSDRTIIYNKVVIKTIFPNFFYAFDNIWHTGPISLHCENDKRDRYAMQIIHEILQNFGVTEEETRSLPTP